MPLSTEYYGYIVDPFFSFMDDKGKTIKNGFLRVFLAGSSTPAVTYLNWNGAMNQETIQLDNSGRCYTLVIGAKDTLYKVCVYDSQHSQETPIITVDNVQVLGAVSGILDGSVTTSKLADEAVTSEKIYENAVTNEKLALPVKVDFSAVDNRKGRFVLNPGTSLSNDFTQENTIYYIRDRFDLNGQTVTVPNGSELVFEGGSFVNGTLDLNNSAVRGKGLCCSFTNPKNEGTYQPLSYYLGDTSNPSLNHDVIQTLVDAEIGILLDIQEVIVGSEINVKRLKIKGTRKENILKFPNGKGFVWNQHNYSSFNEVSNFSLHSDGHCFVLCEETTANTRPYNVYLSNFVSLNLTSDNGNCVMANDNQGSGGSACVFDCLFRDMYISAPNGSGFVGLDANTIRFEKIAINKVGDAAFDSCGGVFDSVNGSYTTNFSPHFFKTHANVDGSTNRIFAIFINCNIEAYTQELFMNRTSKVYVHLSLLNCKIQIYRSSPINYYPFDFVYLNEFYAENNFFLYNQSFESGYCNYRIDYPSQTTKFLPSADTNTVNYNNGSYTAAMAKPGKFSVESGFNSGTFNAKLCVNYSSLSVDFFMTKGIKPNFATVNIDSSSNIISIGTDLNYISLKDSDDTAGTHNVYGYSTSLANNIVNKNRRITILNGNTNKSIALQNNLNGTRSFFTHNHASLTLAPGEAVEGVIVYGVGILLDEKYRTSVDTWYTSGSTTNRPTLSATDEGFEYYDSTLKKKILWNGTDWVNVDGSVL
jgi:hypothetical protein